MATKRGDKSRLELSDFTSRRENEFIEKVVLPNDTLQGIALLYNTTVADLKRINHFHTDSELHAHRIIKVPAKGILVNLEPEAVPILLPAYEEDEEEVEENGHTYLSNVDAALKEIKEKAEIVAANSVVAPTEFSMNFRKAADDHGEIKWWKIFLPCLGTLIVFPILYFFYRHHLPSVPLHNATHHMSHPH